MASGRGAVIAHQDAVSGPSSLTGLHPLLKRAKILCARFEPPIAAPRHKDHAAKTAITRSTVPKGLNMKTIITATFAALALGAASLMTAAPAQAARCDYVGYDMYRNLFTEVGRALKTSEACDRARRQCNRQLERWQKRGKVGRGSGCARMTQAGG
jgi:hypothetical protein